MKLKHVLSGSKTMKDYLAHKPKYFLLKRIIRKRYFLIKIFLILIGKK